jgi:wyosine [tRNA(Phe)-imidazoG37] synthetase (radical SAM superfamily)
MATVRNSVLSDHARRFDELRFAYPVVSRRSRGLSLGVNVNPDKVCNFHCPYCQVDRTTLGADREVDFEVMVDELDSLMAMAKSGEIWKHPRFAATPAHLRRINDIAFAGDGEPTTYPRLGDALAAAAQLRTRHGLPDLKLILITNATRLGETAILDSLEVLKSGPYEIWAKLDAGTQPWFEKVNGTGMALRQIVRNIAACASRFEVTIQSLFPTTDGKGPSDEEIDAYIGRLKEIGKSARLKMIQVYTTARKPADTGIGMLSDVRLDEIAARVRKELPVPVEAFYGRQWE